MWRTRHASPVGRGSISLRLSALAVGLLVIAALAVGYLFDRGRSETLRRRELENLRLHTERAADEVSRFIARVQGDCVFLARTPPIGGIARAIEEGGIDVRGGSSLDQWIGRLQQIFLAFAEARPQYVQIRLIGVRDQGRELVGIDRTGPDLQPIPQESLQQKAERDDFQDASRLEPGSVYLSPIDLDREHGHVGIHHRPTLRAATPVHDARGKLFGVVVINMDIEQALERAEDFTDPSESLYVAEERGRLLHHPHLGGALAAGIAHSSRVADELPGVMERLATLAPGQGAYLDAGRGVDDSLGYLSTRAFDPRDPARRLVFILTESPQDLSAAAGLVHPERFLGTVGLLLVATGVFVVAVHRQTRTLGELAKASEAIAGGDFPVVLPAADSSEIGSLVRAFRHMSEQVAQREESLAELNRSLEDRVRARTRELSRQHDLQGLILDSIADGVVVVDPEGRVLLWNKKARQIIGVGPQDLPPDRWSRHYGIFDGESGELVPTNRLPLVRAIHGEPATDEELYFRHPGQTDGRWVHVTARPLRDPGDGVSGAVAVLIDVTEQRRLQGQVQMRRRELVTFGRLRLGAEIASAAAHQLSQPLAAIATYAGAALRLHAQGGLTESDLSEMLGSIERLSAQAGETLDRLRARIRRRGQQPVAFDLSQVARSSLDHFQDRLRGDRVRVEQALADRLPMVLGDPMELEHALVQVITNALDAMDQVAPSERGLLLRTDYDEDRQRIIAEIADTGPGISPSVAERIFEPWETDKPGALGIGLSIAQTIIEGFDGRMRFEQRRSGGALFRIELPVQGNVSRHDRGAAGPPGGR